MLIYHTTHLPDWKQKKRLHEQPAVHRKCVWRQQREHSTVNVENVPILSIIHLCKLTPLMYASIHEITPCPFNYFFAFSHMLFNSRQVLNVCHRVAYNNFEVCSDLCNWLVWYLISCLTYWPYFQGPVWFVWTISSQGKQHFSSLFTLNEPVGGLAESLKIVYMVQYNILCVVCSMQLLNIL